MKEATGADLKISAIPGSDFTTKLPLMMASPESLPDLLHTWQKRDVDDYALTGAYLSYDDHMDEMPNFQKFWATVPEEEKNELFNQRRSADGKIYSAPSYGSPTAFGNMRTWMYRKDIFEKHGLQPPETYEELYQVCKKLKELYPDSYPLCFRNGLGKIGEFGPSWQTNLSWNGYYDFSENTWEFSACQPVMKEIAEYFLKLQQEELVPPDYITLGGKTWEELMSTDRGFITLDYMVRIDFFNLSVRQENPEYTLAMMAPPKADTPEGAQLLMRGDLDFNGYSICNTGKEKNIQNAFRFVDWLYTDEACELLSWGKEGETYEVKDGKRYYLCGENENAQQKYGVGTYGVYQRMDPAAIEALYSEEQIEACREIVDYTEPNTNPLLWMSFTEDEMSRKIKLEQDICTYAQEEMSKFLLGQEPLSEWDTFQKGLKESGVDELLQIYKEAYDRITQ